MVYTISYQTELENMRSIQDEEFACRCVEILNVLVEILIALNHMKG